MKRKVENPLICHHCQQAGRVIKHGLGRSGLQRYFCHSCKKTFQVDYYYSGHEMRLLQQVKDLLEQNKNLKNISEMLGIELEKVERYMLKLMSAE
ncbi:MAG: hypothetical protein LBN41_11485 [Enterobacteriaceae bacterium]|jgi:transposase-like protein|nr:hypothetical protein [Enterobacteriaceae bacterium]